MNRINPENDVPEDDTSRQIEDASAYAVRDEVAADPAGAYAEYDQRDIDQIQPGDQEVQPSVTPVLDVDQIQPGDQEVQPPVTPVLDIDQVQPGDVYTAPGTEPLTGDLDTGHFSHEHEHDLAAQPRLPVDRVQTTRPLDPNPAETRVLPSQPDIAAEDTTPTEREAGFQPYIPDNDNSD